MTNKTFGEEIKTLRKEKKLTQKQISRMLNISNTYISMVENGITIPPVVTIMQLAEILGVGREQLILSAKDFLQKQYEKKIENKYKIIS